MLPKQYPLILFLALLLFTCTASPGLAAIIDVGSGYSYTTIASGLAAANSGDTVHVHPGTYTITSTIQPSKNNIMLYGDGYNNTIIKGDTVDTFHYDAHDDPRGTMIWINGISGFEIYGFKIDGGCGDNTTQHSIGGTGDGGNAITIRSGATDISVHDIYFTLTHGDSIFGGTSSYVDVYNCLMLKSGHDGVQLWGASHWNITNCVMDRNINSGVRLASSTAYVNISQVTVYSTGGGGYANIEWEGAGAGNTVDHCVFAPSATPVIADYSGSGTMGFTNNICYNVPLQTSPVGSLTLSPYSGNQYTTTTWNWVDAGYGFDPYWVSPGNGTGVPLPVYNGTPAITLVYPTNESLETTVNNKTTFTWSDVNSTSYRIIVANNSSFNINNTTYNTTTSSSSISLTLSQNETYWWKVQGKIDTNGTWTNYTTARTFTVIGNRELAITSGIYGYVYDTVTTNVIEGAVVTMMNGSWSSTYVTRTDGYYEFSVERGSGIYYLRASATDYQTSPDQLPLNLTGEYVYENIALTKSPSYFLPHYVTFTVTDIFGNLYENVSVTIFKPTDLSSPYMAGYTDSSGSVTFVLNQTALYTIVLHDDAQNIDRTLTLSPSESAYNLWVWGAHKTNDTINEISPNVTTDNIRYIFNYSAYNLSYYSVNVSIQSVSGLSGIEMGSPISSYNITIWQINDNNGTRAMINNNSAYYTYLNGTGDISTTFLVPGNATYVVQSWVIDPDYDSSKPAFFFNKFYAGENPVRLGYRWFDWNDQWNYTVFAYCLMLLAGGLFGRSNANVGALLVGLIGMFSWYTGWIQYSLGDQIMAMFGVLILIIYILSRRE